MHGTKHHLKLAIAITTSMSRLRTRKLVLYIIGALVFAICLIFVVEWSYIEKLKEAQETEQLAMPRSVVEVVHQEAIVNVGDQNQKIVQDNYEIRTPCPALDSNSLKMNLNDLYKVLKRRKQSELRMEKTTQEMWWYIRNRLNHMDTSNRIYLDVTMNSVRHHYNSLRLRNNEVNDISPDSEPFQLNWKYWQKNISTDLALLMQKRIEYLQNPSDCESANKLVCHVAKACGFGCQIHHVAYCFIMAYATKRTLVVDSGNWRYSPQGWDAVFQPLSTTCTQVPRGNVGQLE